MGEKDEIIFFMKIEIPLGVKIPFPEVEEYASFFMGNAHIVKQLGTVLCANLIYSFKLNDDTFIIEVGKITLFQPVAFIIQFQFFFTLKLPTSKSHFDSKSFLIDLLGHASS